MIVGLATLRKQFSWPVTRPDLPLHIVGASDPSTVKTIKSLGRPENLVVVEIGSHLGFSTIYHLAANPAATVIAIDLFADNLFYHDPLFTLTQVQRNLWPWRQRTILMSCNSHDGLRAIHNAGVAPNLIYIDGDHAYPQVIGDVSLSVELFPDATIAGHDYNEHEGTRQAVDEVAAKHGLGVEVLADGVTTTPCWLFSR